MVYHNSQVSVSDTTRSCGAGEKPGVVSYTVPAGRYTSLVSQADANGKAMEEARSNIFWYADDPAHRSCLVNYDPDWEWEEGDPTDCIAVGSETHKFYFMKDRNPNSPTYNQTQWVDTEEQGDCQVIYPSYFTLVLTTEVSRTITLTDRYSGASYVFMDVLGSLSVPNFPAGAYDVQFTPTIYSPPHDPDPYPGPAAPDLNYITGCHSPSGPYPYHNIAVFTEIGLYPGCSMIKVLKL